MHYSDPMDFPRETGRANTGYGPRLSVMDIGCRDNMAVIDPDSALWHIVPREELPRALAGDLAPSVPQDGGGYADGDAIALRVDDEAGFVDDGLAG